MIFTEKNRMSYQKDTLRKKSISLAVLVALQSFNVLADPQSTTAISAQKKQEEIEKTSRLVGQHFKYVEDLSADLREKVRECHAFYNRKRHLNDRSGSKADFEKFMSLLTKKECVLIHKGENDIVALKNTLTKMGLGLPPFEDIDLDRASMLHKNVPNKRLNTLNSHYGRLYPELVAEKDELMGKIARFMKDRFLEDAGDLTSHNPLVDCAAALVLYKGTRKMLEKAVSSGGTRRIK